MSRTGMCGDCGHPRSNWRHTFEGIFAGEYHAYRDHTVADDPIDDSFDNMRMLAECVLDDIKNGKAFLGVDNDKAGVYYDHAAIAARTLKRLIERKQES